MFYNVKINEVKNQDGKVKAFANITFGDCLAVRNISIVGRKNGDGFFVSMPSYKSDYVDEFGQPEYKDICFPITSDFHRELTDNILDAYQAKVKGELDKDGMDFGNPSEALDFSVRMTPVEREGSTLCAYGQITLENSFVISNVSVVQGQYGEFVSMPSYKNGSKGGSYRDLAFPVTNDFREELFGTILQTYHQDMEHQQTMNYEQEQQPMQAMVAENGSRSPEEFAALR